MRGLAVALVLAGIVAGRVEAQPAPDAPSKRAWLSASPSAQAAAPPLHVQADEIIHEAGNRRVIARGSVELYFKGYSLVAHELIYDRETNKLTAQGKAVLLDPSGTITQADRMEMAREFVDAFAASLEPDEPGQPPAQPGPN